MKLTIHQIAHHRNGIAGAPFHVLLFRDPEAGPMLGIVFAEEGQVAVLQLDRLTAGDIAFGSNSWRGDVYEPEFRRAINSVDRSASGGIQRNDS